MHTNDFQDFDRGQHRLYTAKAEMEKSFHSLIGIIDGIKCDQNINNQEVAGLKEWLESVKEEMNKAPYNAVVDTVNLAIKDNILTTEEAESIKFVCRAITEKSGYYDMVTASLQKLHGIVSGIVFDKKINDLELRYLDQWMENHSYLQNSWPYDELSSLTTSILADGIITEQERQSLLHFCEAVSGDINGNGTDDLVETLKMGFCQIDPQIHIPESTFCITGISPKYRREEIGQMIELYGGYLSNGITKKLNYLVVCDKQNSCWAFSCYGRKIEKAVSLRKKGIPIAIINEFDLYDTIEGLK